MAVYRIAVAAALLLTFAFLGNGLSSLPNVDTVDTPTAVTLPRGNYGVGIWGYNDGGLLTKAIIGLHDNIYMGVSFDVENAIGSEEAQLNIPGVVAKIKFTDGWEHLPILLAIGYDSFYSGFSGKIEGSENPYNRVIYGPYAVITKPFFAFGTQQNFHIGVRTPVQPLYVPENTSMYVAIDFPIGDFVPMFEVERIYFDGNRSAEVLANLGFRFNFFESLAFELDFMMAKNETTNRMVIIEYQDSF